HEEFEAEGRSLDETTVLVLGVAYRPGVAETAATPAGPIIDGLDAAGADVLCADPLIDDFGEFDATPVATDAITDRAIDGVVMVTPHEQFEQIDWQAFPSPLVVVDGRGALDLSDTPHRVYTIGSGRDV